MARWFNVQKRPVIVQARGPLTEAEVICTLEGDLVAALGDYVIRGVDGEDYPCKPEIFHQTYDALADVLPPGFPRQPVAPSQAEVN